jgi:hypothetical protein
MPDRDDYPEYLLDRSDAARRKQAKLNRATLWILEQLEYPAESPCNRCGHARDDHRIDDSLEQDVTTAPTRCIWPMVTGPPVHLCDCPNYVGTPK